MGLGASAMTITGASGPLQSREGAPDDSPGVLDPREKVAGQPAYGIGWVNLSQRWVELVKAGKVVAKVKVPADSDPMTEISVEYGVRLAARVQAVAAPHIFEEFVQQSDLPHGPLTAQSGRVRIMSETLSKLQSRDEASAGRSAVAGSSVRFGKNGDFTAQLQLVRTLRPAPSPGFAESTSSIPARYDSATDSFISGPLRLELRPLVARIFKAGGMTTPWDIFHNVSPADARGHFLLLPTLSDPDRNCRGQVFEAADCQDMVHLTSMILSS